MKTNLLLILAAMLLLSFSPKADKIDDLEYELRSLTRSFAANANEEDCEYFFRKINALEDDIEEAIDDNEGDLIALKRVLKKTAAFYDFAATLTRCHSTSNEVDISNFNTFIRETGLSPVFIKQNDCVSIYRVNINGFYSFYAVNPGDAKTVKITIKKGDKYNSSTSTNSFGIMCNSVEGFNQGEAQGKFSTMAITCTPLSSSFGIDCN
ncbi:hypothetical protein [uncultured Pontibacter sp.]|uniref:hypothetical protein n=1 Tax=uncultured Pontibacter sp. TaxID=453356 RepID=UPI00262CE55F|nr:hypothetical protein [uncultured Pontibacter sp.]